MNCDADSVPKTIDLVGFLYGIDSSVSDDSRLYEPPRVVRFRVTKKTAKRIYYAYHGHVRFVDRHRIETDGEIYRRSAGWWEPEIHLYLEPPVIETARRPNLTELKTAMVAAHPDRGGSDEAFIAARHRYETVRNSEKKVWL